MVASFFTGRYTTDYEEYKKQSDSLLEQLNIQLQLSELERDSLVRSIESVDSTREVIYDSLAFSEKKESAIVGKFKPFSSIQLESLMIEEYNKYK